MKYFLVISDYSEGYDGYSMMHQTLYSADSKEDLFKFIHDGRGYDYEIQESDVFHPRRESYKTEESFEQAMRMFKERVLPDKLDEMRREWNSKLELYKSTTVELDIPCSEVEMREIQSFDVV